MVNKRNKAQDICVVVKELDIQLIVLSQQSWHLQVARISCLEYNNSLGIYVTWLQVSEKQQVGYTDQGGAFIHKNNASN